jgi:glutamyl-tRNA synthetase
MREERGKGIASRRRDATVEENLSRFEEMTKGTEEGVRWCLRAKMSVDNPNKAMRDPVIYRCNHDPHHRTGYAPLQICCIPLNSNLLLGQNGRFILPTTLHAQS